MANRKSFWQRLFSRREPAESREDPLAKFERVPEPWSPASSAREVRRSTSILIRSAVEQRRFETAAFSLQAVGKAAEAERLGDEALRAGKYGQAIRIFTHIRRHEKIAIANEMAARDCLKRKAPRKVTAGHLYAAIQAYGQLLTPTRSDRLAIMRKMLDLAGHLVPVLEEAREHLGAADTCLYCAQMCVHLDAAAQDQQVYVQDPEFYEGVRQRAVEYAVRAREGYRQYVEASNLSPDEPEGRKVVEKLKAVQRILDAAASVVARPA